MLEVPVHKTLTEMKQEIELDIDYRARARAWFKHTGDEYKKIFGANWLDPTFNLRDYDDGRGLVHVG